MSFGFSVGDFITAIELANRIRKEFVGAPSQFKDISNEVRSLSIVLQDVEIVLPERDLTSEQQTEFHDIAGGCRNILKDLNETLNKYEELDSNPKTFGRKARRTWKRLKWEPEDIKELRNRIIANITLLNAFQGRLDSQVALATKDGVDRLHERQDTCERREERHTILNWLTPFDYAPQQTDLFAKRQEGTGQWLLKSDEFHQWLSKSKQTLFCSGMPGAGKTMITSITVDHLCTRFLNDASIGIAYVYCNFRRHQEQKPTDLLLSLLKQLLQERPTVPESVKSLYDRHKDKRTRSSFDEVSKVLHSVVVDYSRTFIVIDALDECPVSDGARSKLLSELFRLQAGTGASLFATSRLIPEIEKTFRKCLSLEIRASDEDVQIYVDGHISLLPSFVLHSRDLREEIKTEVIKAVDGMFLLAQLHLGSLIGKRSPKAIRTALKRLPTGSDAYDQAYKEAMERIEGQISDSKDLARQVLAWITCAKRPLTTLELRHALAVEIGEPKFDEESLPEIEDMISVCAGLVTIDEKSATIRLVHYTTQEYFERTQMSWFPNAQRDIVTTCVTYLSFDAFETGFCQTDEDFETKLRFNPFYDYAARNWGHHARVTSTEAEQLILDFFESEAKVSASNQAMLASRDFHYHGYSQDLPRQTAGVHLAAYFGLKEVMVTLLKNGHDPNFEDSYGQTPLSWAAMNGRGAVVELLLATDGVDPNFKDNNGRTPLSWAAGEGYKAMVDLLLAKSVNPCSKDEDGRTPLSWAAENGHETVVKLLLATDGMDPNSKDNDSQTPLSWAAWHGHEAVVKLLLANDGVDPDSKDNDGQTPLSWAARNGYSAVAKLLLSRDNVEPDSKNNYGRTPLWWAVRNEHKAVVKLLLMNSGVNSDSKDNHDRTPLSLAAGAGYEAAVMLLLAIDGVHPNFKDNDGRTPLSWAAINGHSAVVELLLARDDTDPDSKDHDSKTPLWWAAGNGHKAVVELLLANNGVDPDSKDNDGRTPLSRAAENGHEAVVELLVAKDGVDLDSKATEYFRTPSSWAAGNGCETVVKLLLAKDAIDPDFKDNKYGRTPLWWAAENGHDAVVELLLATDRIDPDSKDHDGQTPLSGAAENGHETVVKLLLEKDSVNPNSKSNEVRTPLSGAVGNGHEAVVKLLLARDGVDPNSKDITGGTPLSVASAIGNDALVKLLLARDDVNLNSKDITGRTPLFVAAAIGNDTVVKLLLSKDGVDPNSKNKYGRTPLSLAARMGHEAVVTLLLAVGGIDPNSKDYIGQTPLLWAARKGHESVVKLLLMEDGVEPDCKDDNWRTPLSWAAEKGHEAVVKLLLTAEADIETEDYGGRTPLIWAAKGGCDKTVKLLLENNADVNAGDKCGSSAVQLAAFEVHKGVEQLLMKQGASEPEDFYGLQIMFPQDGP